MEFITNFDCSILSWINDNMVSQTLTPFMAFITSLGNIGLVWIVIAIILMSMKKYRKYGFTLAIALILWLIIGDVILKNLVERLRPFYVYDFGPLLIQKPSGFSFPSGHTASSFAAAFILIKANKKWGIAGYILASLIAFSRMYFCVHYPTDILGGIIVGTLIAILAFYIYQYIVDCKKKKI